MSIFGASKPFICSPTASFSSKSYSGNGTTMTVTLGTGHGVIVGNTIYIAGITIFDVAISGATTVSGSSSSSASGTANIHVGYKFANSIYDFDFVQADQINHRSVISGVKTNTFLGDYGEFRITERMWQNITTFTAKLRFQKLNSLYHTDVWFMPHGGLSIKNSASADVTCYFKSLKPQYYKGFISYDAAVCEFETNKYHDITKILV